MAATKPAKIQPLGTKASFVRLALVAPQGFGKTVYAGTSPRALFLTTDPEGTLSAAKQGSTAEEWPILTWQELLEAYRWLRDGGAALYDWVWIDNITECQNLCMKEAMERAVARNADRDPYVPDKFEYQRTQNAMLDMVRMFHDLPINVGWTVHRKGMEDGDGAEYYSAAIQGQQGQVAQTILGYCNMVAMGEVLDIGKEGSKKQVRRFYFSHTRAYRGKDRFDVMGAYRDDLTVPKMMQLIKADLRPTTKDATPAKRAVAKKAAAPIKRPARRAG
jgi:hypothetical protein